MPSRPVRAPTAMIGLPTPCATARMSSFFAQQADAHRVDERVAFVRRIERDFAGDGRNADAVAVVADAFDDAGEQVADARRIERSEAERVEHRDRTRAHREHVAEDAADAGCGALIRLDGGRMVVRLDLEGDGESVADRDDAGVFAGALQHVRRLGREGLEQRPRVLVGAVLAPQRADDSQLGERRLATEHVDEALVLVGRQSVFARSSAGVISGSPGRASTLRSSAVIVT